MELERKTIEEARRDNYIQFTYSHSMGMLRKRYDTAVAEQNEEEAAEAAREYRNKLLDSCDSMMIADRPNVDIEAWRAYRQALRDVPEQAGFPMDIAWPEEP